MGEGMMNKRWIVPALVMAGLMAGIGCDDKPSVPPAVLQQQAKTAEEQKHPNKHPTTQELLSGKRSRTALIPIPLTMEQPPDATAEAADAPELRKVSTT